MAKLEAARRAAVQVRERVAGKLGELIQGELGVAAFEGHADWAWYVQGDDTTVAVRRRELETLAEVLEGYRARLMNASHRIQLEHDKAKRRENGHGR